MSMTSVVCNVPVLSQNDSTYHHSVFTTWKWHLFATWTPIKFHHPSLGASPPNRGNRISCIQNSRKTENRYSVNNSGIGILCSKNSNERLAVPAVAGLLVLYQTAWQYSDGNPPPNGSVECRWGRQKSLSEPISGFTVCCEPFQRQVQYT